MHDRQCACVACMPPHIYYEIGSMSEWYTYCWNSFLLLMLCVIVKGVKHFIDG